MSELTQVDVRRGTEGLGRSQGFWSGKDVLFNNDESTIYVLDEKTTSQDLLDTIRGVIDADLRDWVQWDMLRNIESALKGKPIRTFFNPSDIPTLQQSEWIQGRGVSVAQMLKHWQKEGKTPDQLSEFLADKWVATWQHDVNLLPNMWFGIPAAIPLARLLFVRWNRLDGSMPLETFLQNLWNLAEMDMSGERFLGQGRYNQELFNNKLYLDKLRDGLSNNELELLAKFGFSIHLEGKMTGEKVRAILSAPLSASMCMLVLAEKGLLLPPRNFSGDPLSRIRELGWMKPFERWMSSKDNRVRFAPLLVSSTIREPRDIPADLRDQWGIFPHNNGPNLRLLRTMLLEYGDENDLPTFDLSPFESHIATRVDIQRRMWCPQWFREQGHPEAWCNFADAAFNSSSASITSIADQLRSLCEWALDRFASPWDITSLDLLNPHNPKKHDTFAAFCKKRIDNAGKGGKDPLKRWTSAASMFKRVKNVVSIPEYPWYREDATNPFELLPPPFKGKSRGNKTHRSRIATLIHEKMIKVLLDIDENGKPTFAWARTQFHMEDLDTNGTWCPSRWAALAVLLLLPLRKKSVRWLDQGLMDEKVFDPETFKMVDNTHPLRNYTYEDGETHLQRYGRPSGVVQQMTDDFMGNSAHIGLFINTNKTQLWNPKKRCGYELPWPDGGELLASNDKELRQHGLWLRRVYEVLAYQYRYVMEQDPNPEPVTFADVRGDAEKVSAAEDCAERMPRFIPLFREPRNKKQIERDGALRAGALPVSEAKIENAYIALCMETEAQLKAEGYDSVSLTLPRKSAAESGVSSRRTKFDIHCLRVAGISRLIEIGIDPVIVQEFVAGHLTPAMTHRYLKMQPWHVREKIIEAIINGDFKSAMETFAEKVAKGEWDRKKTFVGLPRFQDHVANLPEDFACFAVVKGGICVMGGKGDACTEGGVYECQSDGKDADEVEFGPVQGGCGNCIYFRTAAFLIQEQTLVLNILLAELRAQARERKELRTKISDLTCKVDEADGSSEKNRLVSDKSLHEARIEELNHDMVPRLTEWVNRYIMLKECEGQLDELLEGNADTTALVAPFGENIGLSADDLKVDQEMTPDIGLIGRIVEGSRILGARGIAVPKDHARFLERGVDKLLRMNGSQHLLLDAPESERVHGASMMFNALEDLIGAEAMQKALDSETPLALPGAMSNRVNQFAGALVGAAQKGSLTIDHLLNEGRNCNMITDTKEGVDRWAM